MDERYASRPRQHYGHRGSFGQRASRFIYIQVGCAKLTILAIMAEDDPAVAMWAAVSLSNRSAFGEINVGKNLTKYSNILELESRVSSPSSDSARASWRAVYSFI